MKIIYKKPILEQVAAAIDKAKMTGKEIASISITPKERNEIRKALCMPPSMEDATFGIIMGVRFNVEKDIIDEIFGDVFNNIFKGVEPGETNAPRADDCTRERRKDNSSWAGCAGR